MTRSELVAKLAARTTGLNAPDVAACVTHILDAMAARLRAGGRIEIRGFGALSVGYRAPRRGRNPATGAEVNVAGKNVVRFKMGHELRQRVDSYEARES